MIVELFGPPGSGKTTFSQELAAHLRARGLTVKLALSRRPAEGSASGARHVTAGAPLRRFVRPCLELICVAAMSEARNGGLRLTGRLLRLFPQRVSVRSLRLRQYLLRLHAAWHEGSRGDAVVIFDQGFVQAVYSLACVSAMSDAKVLGAAIDCVPQPDLAILVGAPPSLLRSRLAERLARQGWVERMLERDAMPTAQDAAILQACEAQLDRRGTRVLAVTTEAPDAIATAVAAICSSLVPSDTPKTACSPKREEPIAQAGGLRPILRRGQRPLTIAAAAGAVACLVVLGVARLDHFAAASAGSAERTTRHYASQANFDAKGHFLPAEAGFDLADVSSPAQLDSLPPNVKALVWVGLCHGVDAAFQARVSPFLKRREVLGFYLMDDPDPSGRWREPCPPENLRDEVDWIRSKDQHTHTFVALMNVGSSEHPSFRGLDPLNSHVDLYGIPAYPCRVGLESCDLTWIDRAVDAAVDAGIGQDRIVPIFQAFGGGGWMADQGGHYALPTEEQARAQLRRWESKVPRPVFDFAYSWGSQRGDTSLRSSPALQAVFKDHNGRAPRDAQAAAPQEATLPPSPDPLGK